jgi:hypothetical protein
VDAPRRERYVAGAEPSHRTLLAMLVELSTRAGWREVEVHRVDLGAGDEPRDWPSAYVGEELVAQGMRWNARRPVGLAGLPAEALRARAAPTGRPGCSVGVRSPASADPT